MAIWTRDEMITCLGAWAVAFRGRQHPIVQTRKDFQDMVGRVLEYGDEPDAAPKERMGRVTRALCASGRFETGEGGCAFICMDILGSSRSGVGCHHRLSVHEKLAGEILAALDEGE